MLKDYIKLERPEGRNWEGRWRSCRLRFSADQKTLHLTVSQYAGAPRARLILALTSWGCRPGVLGCSRYAVSHIALPLPFSLDV